jgi:hypothetical protein
MIKDKSSRLDTSTYIAGKERFTSSRIEKGKQRLDLPWPIFRDMVSASYPLLHDELLRDGLLSKL